MPTRRGPQYGEYIRSDPDYYASFLYEVNRDRERRENLAHRMHELLTRQFYGITPERSRQAAQWAEDRERAEGLFRKSPMTRRIPEGHFGESPGLPKPYRYVVRLLLFDPANPSPANNQYRQFVIDSDQWFTKGELWDEAARLFALTVRQRGYESIAFANNAVVGRVDLLAAERR